MNILKKVFIASIFIVSLFFSKKIEAYFDFPCSTSVDIRKTSVVITVVSKTSEKEYDPKLLKIGILDANIKDYAGYADFKNALDVFSDKITATYSFDGLKDGVTYRTLLFNNDANDTNSFIKDLSDCKFTVPAIVNGVCGDAKGKTFPTEPKTELCKSGTPSKVKPNYNQWEWNCDGENGGKNSQTCIAIAGGSTSTTTTTTDSLVDASSKGGGLVPDCPADGCGFDQLMEMINKVIKFLLFTIATPLAALIFVYAGFMLLTSGGSSEKMTTAKKILTNLIIGYVIALAAWLVINTILTSEFLGYKGPTFLKDK